MDDTITRCIEALYEKDNAQRGHIGDMPPRKFRQTLKRPATRIEKPTQVG